MVDILSRESRTIKSIVGDVTVTLKYYIIFISIILPGRIHTIVLGCYHCPLARMGGCVMMCVLCDRRLRFYIRSILACQMHAISDCRNQIVVRLTWCLVLLCCNYFVLVQLTLQIVWLVMCSSCLYNLCVSRLVNVRISDLLCAFRSL